MTSADKFDQNMAHWLEDGQQPWSKLRYAVINVNLNRHLPQRPLHILDAGGGSGRDAIRLALQGHTVTVLDYSEAMLREARQDAEASGVGEKIKLQLGKVEDITALYPTPQFDVVLFNNVIQYMADAKGALQAVFHPLLAGGFLSLTSINRYSVAYRDALLNLDLDSAYNQLDKHEMYTVTFDAMTTVYSGEEVIQRIADMGHDVVGHYGVRCINDYIADNQRKYDPAFYAELERLEIAMSDRYPYYLLARIFQIVAQKR
ncbi:MAG: methyltransferase domain-containing protein [Anaerolineae bacterium]|nr:methyltransferase domain-containing protein [Anaerolineae bacterium]